MPAQKVPENQLAALPLMTADVNANPGEYYIVGNSLIRFWSKENLNINAVALADDPYSSGTYTYLVTNWLDVRGCSAFQGVLTRSVSVVGSDSVTPIKMYSQYRSQAGIQPPTGSVGATLGGELATITPVGKPALAAYPWTYVTARSLQFASVNPSLIVGVIGFNVRLWFSRVTASVYAGELYSLELWGTSQ